jgi:D-threonate/D-erythronate kinase
VIVADDLTSATDCGVQMMTGRYRTVIPLRPGVALPDTADIVALDTDSRNVPAQEAYRLTRDAIAAVGADPGAAFYKSIDSTLRGNLGAELDAIFDAGQFDAAVVAPAFPTYGRTTRDGLQFLDGRPLDQTEFASDPTAPVTSADIARRFAEQSRRSAALVSLVVQQDGAAAVFEVLEQRREAGDELFIFDAAEEGDLERLAGIIGALPGRFLWVGSTGLSRYVPRAVGLVPRSTVRPVTVADGCVLVVAGSASKTTRAQLDACAELSDFVEVRIDTRAIAKGGGPEEQELERVRHLLRAAAGRSGAVALTLTAGRAEIAETKALAAKRGLAAGEIETYLAHTMGQLTAELLNGSTRVKGLVLTGGTTAKMIVSHVPADAIEILEEIEPGIPLGHMGGRDALLVVTKAGGFGGPGAILRSVERIAGYGQG